MPIGGFISFINVPIDDFPLFFQMTAQVFFLQVLKGPLSKGQARGIHKPCNHSNGIIPPFSKHELITIFVQIALIIAVHQNVNKLFRGVQRK
jgi:hypothetical protein